MQRTHDPGSSRRSGFRWRALITLITTLFGLQIATATIAEAATIQVTPSQAEAGGQIEIRGEGFGAIGEVSLCLDGEQCANLGTVAVVVGQFSTTAQIPVDTAAGQHTLSACQDLPVGGWTCGSTSIDVTAPPTTTTTTAPTTTTTLTTTTTTTTIAPTTTAPTTTPTTTSPPIATTPPRTGPPFSPAPTTTVPPATTPPTTASPTPTISPDTTVTGPPGTVVMPGTPPELDPGAPVDEATTTSMVAATTTTTISTDLAAAGPGSAPPSPPPPTGNGDGSPPETAKDGALLGLGLGDWAMVTLAVALSGLALWLVDRFGTGRRRTRHMFLAGARGWRR